MGGQYPKIDQTLKKLGYFLLGLKKKRKTSAGIKIDCLISGIVKFSREGNNCNTYVDQP